MAPEDVQVPFVVAPAVARVDPAHWLCDSLEPSPFLLPTASRCFGSYAGNHSSQGVGETVLQFAFKTRIRLFYRPTSFSSCADVDAQKLKFKLIDASKVEAASILEVVNPTPYYVLFGRVGRASDVRATCEPKAQAIFYLCPAPEHRRGRGLNMFLPALFLPSSLDGSTLPWANKIRC